MIFDYFLISSTTEFPTVPLSTGQWSCWQLLFMISWVICLDHKIWAHLEQLIIQITFLRLQVSHAWRFYPLQSNNHCHWQRWKPRRRAALFSVYCPLLLQPLLRPQMLGTALTILSDRRKKFVWLILTFLACLCSVWSPIFLTQFPIYVCRLNECV